MSIREYVESELASKIDVQRLPVFVFSDTELAALSESSNKKTQKLASIARSASTDKIENYNIFYLQEFEDVSYVTIWRQLTALKKVGILDRHTWRDNSKHCNIWYVSEVNGSAAKTELTKIKPTKAKKKTNGLQKANEMHWATSLTDTTRSILLSNSIVEIFRKVFTSTLNVEVRTVTKILSNWNPVYQGEVEVKLRTADGTDLPYQEDILVYGAILKCVFLSRLEHARRGNVLQSIDSMSFQVPINSIINEFIQSGGNATTRNNVTQSMYRLGFSSITIKPENCDIELADNDNVEEITIINPLSNLSLNLERTVDGENYRGSGLLIASFALPDFICRSIELRVKESFVRTNVTENFITFEDQDQLHEITNLFTARNNKTLTTIVLLLISKPQDGNHETVRSWKELAIELENGLTPSKLKNIVIKSFSKENASKTECGGLQLQDDHRKIIAYKDRIVHKLLEVSE
jgi:hypothetical protein